MSDNLAHRFGGNWTQEKLLRVEKYLKAYMQIMKDQPHFKVAYIDAFAGTGYMTQGNIEEDSLFFPEFSEDDNQGFLEGSARIALKVEPPFATYVFVEKRAEYRRELEKLKGEFPERNVCIWGGDANSVLLELCEKKWTKRRAVLFLDPYGMQVEWKTLKAIAATKAIDLWLLFPLGIAVARMLPKHGSIPNGWRCRMNALFGTEDWFDAFYQASEEEDMFGSRQSLCKTASFENISEYFVDRLKTIFPISGVAENPLPLRNSLGNPLYLLCFAAGNPKGAPTARRIAKDILER